MASISETTHLLRSMSAGMAAAVEIMRRMADEPSIAILRGPDALRIVADAIEKQAHTNGR